MADIRLQHPPLSIHSSKSYNLCCTRAHQTGPQPRSNVRAPLSCDPPGSLLTAYALFLLFYADPLPPHPFHDSTRLYRSSVTQRFHLPGLIRSNSVLIKGERDRTVVCTTQSTVSM